MPRPRPRPALRLPSQNAKRLLGWSAKYSGFVGSRARGFETIGTKRRHTQ
jgi:hypothetical protein